LKIFYYLDNPRFKPIEFLCKFMESSFGKEVKLKSTIWVKGSVYFYGEF
jgi:hypothetical protein